MGWAVGRHHIGSMRTWGPTGATQYADAVIPERFAPVLRRAGAPRRAIPSVGHRLYLVGGTVRDLLVDGRHQDHDLDLTTDARPPEIKGCLDGWADAIWTQGERFGTIGASKVDADTGETRIYEITTFRADAYTDDSRKPHVVFADEIDADLSRRDFTVNAMALELTGGGGDPHARGSVRRCGRSGNPGVADADRAGDQLQRRSAADVARRALHRAAISCDPTDELLDAVRSMAARLEIVSAERIRDELDKLIVVDHPADGLWFLVDTGLAEQFLPELPNMRLEHDPIHRHKDVLTPHDRGGRERPAARRRRRRHARLRLPDHPPGGPVPRRRQAADPRLPRRARGRRSIITTSSVPASRKKRLTELRYSNDDIDVDHRARRAAPAVPHVLDGLERLGRAALRP